jgi:outer membrane protein OmpA-like peptidoglycan-associated protein
MKPNGTDHMIARSPKLLVAALTILTLLVVPAVARQDTSGTASQRPRTTTHVTPGEKQKISGVIVARQEDSFTLRDQNGSDFSITFNGGTKIEEKKSNPFRGPKKYTASSLVRGLGVEVEGRGDGAGNLSAEKIKFTDEAFVVARTVDSRVTPVEGRVTGAEARLTQVEQNQQRLSGQIDELAAIANVARGGAKAAQETADRAIAGVTAINVRIDRLVSGLDDYEVDKTARVNFRANSSLLSPEAKQNLDSIANQARNQKGYVIEVSGFTSSEGTVARNRTLSQHRADAVVRYLVENDQVPLRRIITPFGYGEMNPIGDNTTRAGREENRRVEVRILVNKGITLSQSATSDGAAASSSSAVTTKP